MPEYQYKCESCRVVFTTLSRTDIPPCPVCSHKAKRDFSTFQARPSMPEHFSTSLGRPVTNLRDLKDGLKRQSDEASERNGIEHNLEFLTRAEMMDGAAHGVTGEGLETQQKAWRDMGQVPASQLVLP